MADDTGENLVSQITVTGGNEAAAEIQSFADKGAAAFDKLDSSVNKSASDIESGANRIGTAGTKAAAGLTAVGAAAPAAVSKMAIFNDGIKKVGDAVGDITSKLPQLTQAIGRFSQRMALAGAGAVAAGLKIANVASSVAAKVGGSTDAFQQNTDQLIKANEAAGQAEAGSIQYQHSQDGLLKQLQQGKISYAQYGQALQQLSTEYDDQISLNNQLQNAQERTRIQNEAIKKSFEDRKAYAALIDQFGGPLTSALVQFGHQVDAVHQSFITAFSPAAGALVDQIGLAFSKNAPAIDKFFNDASTKLQALVTNNGPQLQKFFENVGSAAAAVFNGLIAAAPGIIDFVNNKLAPAFAKVGSILTSVAGVVNFVFGTNFTAGGLVAVAIIGQLTGSFKLLFTILKLGGSIGNGFFKIFGEGALLISNLFGGGKVTAQIIKFGTAAATSGGFFKTFFSIIRSGVPLLITLVEVVGTALGVSFGIALPIVVALGAALFFIIKNVDWTAFGAAALSAINSIISALTSFPQNLANIGAAISSVFSATWQSVQDGAAFVVQNITDTWNAIIGFFADLGSQIGAGLSAAWDAVTSTASAAADLVQQAWQATVNFFSVLGSQISGALGVAWDLVKTSAGAVVQFITDGWNTLVAFFQGLPAVLGQVWTTISTNISDAFQAAYDLVKAKTQAFVAIIKPYLQPIIDLINKIKAGLADVGIGDGTPIAGFAGGGSPGHVRGAGTSTSDSILARLSNNEFVMRAKAVAKYGLGFMHAINSGKIDLPQFNFGGFIAPSPARVAFASGGQVRTGGSSLQPLNLTIGQDTFEGLLMPEEVGTKLTKYAVSRQNRSAGRKPGWVGNRRN